MAQVVQTQTAPNMAASVPSPSQYTPTSLYVGDLDQEVSESELYEIFNQIGQVVSIRICRDLMTKKSLGYAYVNYGTHQEASQALELLNFTLVKGKAIRIMYSHRDPSVRKSGAANIFIKNLDKSIDSKSLYDTFIAFGPILSCRVVTDEAGNSKGYGFVQFEKEEAAQIAIEKVNGMLLHDKQVFVAPFVRKQERDLANAGTKFNNVYVKNLSEATSDEEFRKAFEVFGPISSAVVMRDADGRSKCFGFVNFENADDAAKAVESMNGKIIHDKEWYVGRAQKKSEREAELKAKFEQTRKEKEEKFQGINLYLKNLDDIIDDEKLRDLFLVYGTVTSCKVMKSPNGQSMGSGFVTFSLPEEAMRAVNDMNGKMVGSKPLYVAVAQRKEERRAILQAQFAQMRNIAPNPGSIPVNPPPIYHPGAPGIGQQLFYGQPAPGLMPSQANGFGSHPNGFGYQQPLVPGMRPQSHGVPNYFMPVVQRPGLQGQRVGNRRGAGGPFQTQQQQPPPQHVFPRSGNRSMRYSQFSRTMPDAPLQGLNSLEMSAGNTSNVGLMMPALASALASASPEQQRVMLGEQLYPLVDRLEHDHAGKVTGMLLEMDQTEVLHLIESPEALKAKVDEALEVLRMAQGGSAAIDQLASLSLNEPLAS